MSNESSSFILNPQCDAADIAGVREILTTTEKGKPANTIENFKTVFCRDPLLRDSIRLNLLTEQIDIVRDAGLGRGYGDLPQRGVFHEVFQGDTEQADRGTTGFHAGGHRSRTDSGVSGALQRESGLFQTAVQGSAGTYL